MGAAEEEERGRRRRKLMVGGGEGFMVYGIYNKVDNWENKIEARGICGCFKFNIMLWFFIF